jgi:hypothetical protein
MFGLSLHLQKAKWDPIVGKTITHVV